MILALNYCKDNAFLDVPPMGKEFSAEEKANELCVMDIVKEIELYNGWLLIKHIQILFPNIGFAFEKVKVG
jgi:hypothetical protein